MKEDIKKLLKDREQYAVGTGIFVAVIVIAVIIRIQKPNLVTPAVVALQKMEMAAAVAPHTPTILSFDVDANNGKFIPSKLVAGKGDTVRIHFMNLDGVHNLKIDAWNISTQDLQAGGEDTITFVADKVGTFTYYSSLNAGILHSMKGSLVVTD